MAADIRVAPVAAPIETKTAGGSAAGIITGLLTWALVTFIPAWNAGIPDALLPFIPVAAAWLVNTGTSYLLPHTHRPDLSPDQVAAIADALEALSPEINRRVARHARRGRGAAAEGKP